MKKPFSKIAVFSLAFFIFLPSLALAHQPRLVKGQLTIVPDPEISKAYYGELTGQPDVYVINASAPFDLYANVLVPDITGQKKDISAMVFKDGAQIVVLDGLNFEWKKFYEPFGNDTYWMGPEYKARVEPGTYEIRVWNSNNDSKYSLAIGEIESFGVKETTNALTLIPELKKNFFNESPIGFIISPFGWGLIVVMYLLSFIFGFVYRVILKRLAKETVRGAHKNINKSGRIIRFLIGVALLLWAITTTWSPIILFFSGFCLFESIFSWCGLYAALGKNNCLPR